MSSGEATGGVVKRLDGLYEFERAPVTPDKLQPGPYFAGLFAGEHVAATEFVIGALLVSFGASATDIVFGLLLGNLLAVLSWTFVCAPIAVGTRLTLYWYLRRIAGPGFTLLYNLCNAVMYCVLAGAMITVSASAVRLPFGIPAQTKWYPEDLRFVLVVLVVGAVVVTLAILGFKRLAQFAVVCSPWMVLMFVAGAIVMLPPLAAVLPDGRIDGLADLWTIANQTIWKGASEHASGGLGFWHVVAFAWICNLAMHVGLSDMAIFRFARKASYGLFSAFGMYVGHYLAWVCAGVMGAAAAFVAQKPLTQLDSGDVASRALGVSGALAVVIAGWTTANPTLYRAGLALQVITPNWPRWVVTLVAGVITTVMACSPFVFTKLLDFVGTYGLLLMPVGAIVFVEHWIFPRIGFTRFWASRNGLTVSWPALVAWLGSVALALVAWQSGWIHLFFLALPVWVLTAVVYTALSAVAGAREALPPVTAEAPAATRSARTGAPAETTAPRTAAWTASALVTLATLASLLVLPVWVFRADLGEWPSRLDTFKAIALALTVLYFVAGVIWMNENEKRRAQQAR
ncbi:MAG TPA: nucleoside transporter [Vicinamibacteria bacterium]|nr:nucleoside transporter [Vicinamibacteria bacterium]